MGKGISAADLKPNRSLVSESHIHRVDDPKVELTIVEERQEGACPGVGLDHRLKGRGAAYHAGQTAGYGIENGPSWVRADRH